MTDWSESLGGGGGGGGDASGGGVGDGEDACSDGVRDIRLLKKAGSGTHDWCMLLPLNPQAFFTKLPEN